MSDQSRGLSRFLRLGASLLPLHLALMGIDSCQDPDADGDGWTVDDGDCDDDAPQSYPGASEACDDRDNDCNGQIDDGLTYTTWYIDQDADGFGDPDTSTIACGSIVGYVTDDSDCNDADAEVNPAEDEACDGIDNDCDLEVDEADAIDASTWYPDQDQDGYGDALEAGSQACEAPTGMVDNALDCDDGNADISPGAAGGMRQSGQRL